MLTSLILSCALVGDGPIRNAIREMKPSPPAPGKTIANSLEMLSELEESAKSGIPSHLLAKAEAVVLIPDTIKAGFMLAGRGGHGLALVRTEKGDWGPPTFVNLGGVSFGPQLGFQATDVVLVVKTKKGLERLLKGQSGKLTLGVDAGVAAGPVGRKAEAQTDGQFKSEILSYSKSRGLFAGVSLTGGVLYTADETNDLFARDTSAETAIALGKLKAKLDSMASHK